jgi:hypothetical protein
MIIQNGMQDKDVGIHSVYGHTPFYYAVNAIYGLMQKKRILLIFFMVISYIGYVDTPKGICTYRGVCTHTQSGFFNV